MNDAWFALAGALIGAVPPAVISMLNSRREYERTREDRQDARDAGLFEYRRSAYANFLAKAHGYLNDLALSHPELFAHKFQGDPDFDFLDPLREKLADVELYRRPRQPRRHGAWSPRSTTISRALKASGSLMRRPSWRSQTSPARRVAA